MSSRAKAQRLLTEILTLYDGPPPIALQALIALLAGGNVLLSPRGHHFENLANALAWSFNGVIRKIPAGAPIDAGALQDSQQLAHVLLLEGADSSRLVRLRAALRRAASAEGPHHEPLMLIATADPADIPALGHPDRPVWDETFVLRLNGRDSVQREPAAMDLEYDLLGIDQILPEDVAILRRDVAQVLLPPATVSALSQLPRLLDDAGWPGVPARATEELGRTAQVVAFLRGKKEVNASHVADMLHSVLSARISAADTLPSGLLDGVEEVWDEISRVAVPGKQHVPQRKTFVGTEADLVRPRPSDPEEEASTDPLLKSPPDSPPPPRAPAPPPAPAPPAGPIHGAYYAPPRAYKAPAPTRPVAEEAEDDAKEQEDLGSGTPMFASAAASRAPSRFRSLGVNFISVVLLVSIVVLGTALYPGWLAVLHGYALAGSAQWQWITEDYEPAEQEARLALEKLGPHSLLSHRLEVIEVGARRELRERDRLAREAAAREAYRQKRFDEAATLYEQLAQSFPEHPFYAQFAKEARKQLVP